MQMNKVYMAVLFQWDINYVNHFHSHLLYIASKLFWVTIH